MPSVSRDFPRIAIVDDDEDQLFLTLKILEKSDSKYQCVAIRSGSEIIEYLTRRYEDDHLPSKLPALIFLDLHMPKIDGFTVLRWVRENPALSAVKVVILSSSENPKDIERCKSLGANGFVSKRNAAVLLDYILHQIFADIEGLSSAEENVDGKIPSSVFGRSSHALPTDEV